MLGTAHVHLSDHLTALRSDPDVRLVAVYRGEEGQPVPGVHRVADPVDALCEADAVIVASTTAQHAVLLPSVAAAGLPALVEKPLASTVDASRWLAALLATSRAPVTTAMFLRCAPAFRAARERLDDLGELVSAHARFTHPGLDDGVFGAVPWMLDPRHGAVGGFADLAVHLLDLLRWLRPEASLTADAARLRFRDGVPLDVGGAALVDWGGTPVTLHAGWTARPGGVHLHVEGVRGSLTVSGGTLSTGSGAHLHHPPPAAGDAVVAFLAHLRGQPAWDPPTTADAVEVARVLAALTEQALTEAEP
ncbi:hypothetical protein A6A25_37000 [Saccharothrix sp. CB00851]|nr:hypothetical protein A6A25_37000 [Saccharothrix sp. CB00851]